MEKSYTIQQDAKTLTITLNPHKPLIVSLGLGVEAVIFALMASIFVSMFVSGSGSHRPLDFWVSLPIVFGGLFILLNLLLARSLIRRITHQEIIAIDNTSLGLTDKYLFGKKKRLFKLEHIKQITTAEVENFTQHPLDGNYADIGFRGREGMVRYLITGGNIVISYGKRSIQIGKNIPSWDVEEIVLAIEGFTGRNFSPKAKPELEIMAPTKYRGQM